MFQFTLLKSHRDTIIKMDVYDDHANLDVDILGVRYEIKLKPGGNSSHRSFSVVGKCESFTHTVSEDSTNINITVGKGLGKVVYLINVDGLGIIIDVFTECKPRVRTRSQWLIETDEYVVGKVVDSSKYCTGCNREYGVCVCARLILLGKDYLKSEAFYKDNDVYNIADLQGYLGCNKCKESVSVCFCYVKD